MELIQLLSNNVLFLLLFVAIALGIIYPDAGVWVSDFKVGSIHIVQSINIISIFVISGFTLKASELLSALQNWFGALFGVLSILILSPLFSFGVSQIPFTYKEFAIGFTLFCCVPTTINSCAMISSVALANQAMAILLTCVTNFVGSITTPIFLNFFLSSSSGFDIDAIAILVSLLCVVLFPLIIGVLIRQNMRSSAIFVQTWGKTLSNFSSLSLSMIVWQSISKSADTLRELRGRDLGMLIVVGSSLHICFLVMNFSIMRLITNKRTSADFMRIPNFEFKAILLTASQKSLPICVSILSFIASSSPKSSGEGGGDTSSKLGDFGLITIACVAGHACQLLIDAVLAPVLADAFPNNDFFSSGYTVEDGMTYVSDFERPLLKPSNLRTVNY